MIRVEWTEPAVSDLENIQDYISRDSAEYADAVVERPILSIDQLISFQKVAGLFLNPPTRRFVNSLCKAIE
jgi:plasmid stabilization system protein ParE